MARVNKANQDADENASLEGVLAKTPLAESRRLGHPLYLTPGDYTLALDLDGASAEAKLTVKPPKAFEPRSKPRFKLRGK